MRISVLEFKWEIGDNVSGLDILKHIHTDVIPQYKVRYECCGKQVIMSQERIKRRVEKKSFVCEACASRKPRKPSEIEAAKLALRKIGWDHWALPPKSLQGKRFVWG